tara:strand:- start:6611 stop:7687 length:1077 start_codon:yes stop_codon:yes gene_type:complete
MYSYIIRKIFYGFLVLWGVVTIVFFLFQVIPGDPGRMMMSHREDSKQLELINQKYGFDKPVIDQYFYYLNDISPISLHNNDVDSYNFLSEQKYSFINLLNIHNKTLVIKFPYLRESYIMKGKKVSDIIKETFPQTLILAFSAITISVFFGIILGIFSALNKDSIWDKIVLSFSVFGMSLPSFFTSIIIAWIFAYLLNSYTGLNMTGSLYEVDDYGRGKYVALKNLILPAITLGIRPLSVIIQLTRNSMIEVLHMEYVRTAYSKGISKFLVIYKHALRNALNPLVTVLSSWFASMLAGAVFVEYIFSWNGIGKEIVNSLNNLDIPVVMGSVLFISSFFVLLNILVDIIYIIIDPRVRIN